jgi:hypothetical protein
MYPSCSPRSWHSASSNCIVELSWPEGTLLLPEAYIHALKGGSQTTNFPSSLGEIGSALTADLFGTAYRGNLLGMQLDAR